MDELMTLWLPILLSAVAVFIASALAWMVMPHHKGDYKKLPNEDDVMDAVRRLNIPPGLYFYPHMADCGAMKNDPAAKAKFENGPHGLLHVWPKDAFGKMGRNMVLSFIFYIITSTFVAYIAIHALQPGDEYLKVFQITGTAAFMAYAFAAIPQAIWFGTPLRNVLACVFDALVYCMLTAGFFSWLWPSVPATVT